LGTIQYPTAPTHNGATPSGNTAVYSNPVSVSNGAKRYFGALSYKEGMSDSPVTWYEVDNSGATMAPLAGEQLSVLSSEASSSPLYDANGNLTNYKGWTYSYDAQNRLTSASNGTTTATFYYDGKNRQIARNINGVIRISVWDGWELIEEYRSNLLKP
jgi:YD repeat-containing protein